MNCRQAEVEIIGLYLAESQKQVLGGSDTSRRSQHQFAFYNLVQYFNSLEKTVLKGTNYDVPTQ